MRFSGSLYSMEIRGDLWAHDNSAPVKTFFDKYGVNFNIPFQPIRDCEKCSRLCEECKILSSKLDPSSLLEYTLFYKQTVWSEQHRKWFCDPVFDHKKLRRLGNGSRQVMTRMVKLDEKVAKLDKEDRDSLNDCVTKAIEGGALKVASALPELEGLQRAYIPVGYVCSQSASTPVRAVWDNAFKVDQQSVSLNDCQLTGPNLCSLFRCAAYIRSFRYFASLDIKKSFWNLHVGPLSMSLHRVFVKVALIDGVVHSRLGHKVGEFTEYVMSTLSFGDKAATAHLAVHGIDDLTRKYSAMHLSVPQEVLKQFNVQPAHFSQASRPISLILGSDVWRHLAPVELKRTGEYLLYRSVLTNNLLLAGARRSAPQSTVSQYTLLALNNLHTAEQDIFHKDTMVEPHDDSEDLFHRS